MVPKISSFFDPKIRPRYWLINGGASWLVDEVNDGADDVVINRHR